MAAQNNIAKSSFYDAFFSKSSDGNPWSDSYFCARYNRKTTFPFTGKERDEETGYGYFGARYMDHELMTMWLSVDPMADKYPGISPYAYCAWNPVKLVDPDGRELVLTGESENVNSLLKIINKCFSFSTDVFKVVGGKMQSRELTKDEIANMTTEQQEFYKTVMSVIDDPNEITIGVVSNSSEVLFGSWKLSQIDVADVSALGEGDGVDMYSIIGHELAEQKYKQTTLFPSYEEGHYFHAIPTEKNMKGCLRQADRSYCFNRWIEFNYIDTEQRNSVSVMCYTDGKNNILDVKRRHTILN